MQVLVARHFLETINGNFLKILIQSGLLSCEFFIHIYGASTFLCPFTRQRGKGYFSPGIKLKVFLLKVCLLWHVQASQNIFRPLPEVPSTSSNNGRPLPRYPPLPIPTQPSQKFPQLPALPVEPSCEPSAPNCLAVNGLAAVQMKNAVGAFDASKYAKCATNGMFADGHSKMSDMFTFDCSKISNDCLEDLKTITADEVGPARTALMTHCNGAGDVTTKFAPNSFEDVQLTGLLTCNGEMTESTKTCLDLFQKNNGVNCVAVKSLKGFGTLVKNVSPECIAKIGISSKSIADAELWPVISEDVSVTQPQDILRKWF